MHCPASSQGPPRTRAKLQDLPWAFLGAQAEICTHILNPPLRNSGYQRSADTERCMLVLGFARNVVGGIQGGKRNPPWLKKVRVDFSLCTEMRSKTSNANRFSCHPEFPPPRFLRIPGLAYSALYLHSVDILSLLSCHPTTLCSTLPRDVHLRLCPPSPVLYQPLSQPLSLVFVSLSLSLDLAENCTRSLHRTRALGCSRVHAWSCLHVYASSCPRV